jgi:hypothetical protein
VALKRKIIINICIYNKCSIVNIAPIPILGLLLVAIVATRMNASLELPNTKHCSCHSLRGIERNAQNLCGRWM